MNPIRQISRLLALPLFVVVLMYQKTLSPDHGLLRFMYPNGYCKFYPTCSMYAAAVLKKDGLLGIPKIFKRVVSCNPISMGGVDLPYPTYPK